MVQRNALFGKDSKSALFPMGFEQFYEFQKHNIPLDKILEEPFEMFEWVFCALFQIPMIKYDPARVT